MKQNNAVFTFGVHAHKVTLNASYGDSHILFKVDESLKKQLIPFASLNENDSLLVTVQVIQ